MDKSDLLEEWDVVSVSSVYEGENENAESNTQNKEAASDDTKVEETENIAGDTKIKESDKEDLIDTKANADIVKDNQDSGVDKEADAAVSADFEREASTEPEGDTSEGDSEPCSQIEAVKIVDPEPQKSMPDSEPEIVTVVASEPENVLQCDIEDQSNNNLTAEDTDLKAESNIDACTKEKADVEHDDAELNTHDDNIVEDIVHVQSSPNNNLDSFLSSEIGIEELDIVQIEQEMASIESSSSDIDIIDENVEDSITSSYISPLSLSISSSVADTSSIHSFISPSESIQPKETITQEKETRRSEQTRLPPHENKEERPRGHRQESQRTSHRSFLDWFFLLLEVFRNMSAYDWCIIGGVAGTLYMSVILNQTNIFAVVQKDNVVSQMKDMMNELKNDNKVLKEQMLSELKNKKAISSFEKQIRELRKENSKLSHMLYDVAKVLDKQKYSLEKKESEYLEPFKKEINKLKEHINVLKFDNEELQNELVRMRYSGVPPSQDKPEKKIAEDEEILDDFESLKKWNELITLLSRELGSLAGMEGFQNEKSHSDTKSEKKKPLWKALFTDFKGTVNDLRKLNFTALFSNYKKANEKAISDVYKFVKDFFSVAEHTQQYSSDDSQWKNIGDFVSDLKEKWTNIKDRLYTSDLKKFFENHLKNVESPKTEDAGTKNPSTHSKYEKKVDSTESPDETKWMFKRAAHREEQRNVPEPEEDVNWYLKKGKPHPEDKKKGVFE